MANSLLWHLSLILCDRQQIKQINKKIAMVNFINVLQAAFMRADKKHQKTVILLVFFALLGSARKKSWSYNVDEIDPSRQFHQHFILHTKVLHAVFSTYL